MVQTFDTPLHSSDQSIDRVLKSSLPVVLVFVSGAPPAAFDAAMKSLAKEEAGRLLVVQLDPRDSAQTAGRYGVRQFPAVVTVKNSQIQSQAESITGEALRRHALYLLGKGPRPVPEASRSSGASSTSQGQTGANHSGGQPVSVTDATFDQEVMRSLQPVVVDFWAPWCGPCRMVAPALDKLAREWNGRVKIAKVNVDENPIIAGRYGIQSIPTMMVVKGGRIVEQWAGALPEPTLRSRLSALIR